MTSLENAMALEALWDPRLEICKHSLLYYYEPLSKVLSCYEILLFSFHIGVKAVRMEINKHNSIVVHGKVLHLSGR